MSSTSLYICFLGSRDEGSLNINDNTWLNTPTSVLIHDEGNFKANK
jgi:hypothetical protein